MSDCRKPSVLPSQSRAPNGRQQVWKSEVVQRFRGCKNAKYSCRKFGGCLSCWGACYVSRQDCSIAGRPVPIWQPGNAEEAGRHGGDIEEQRAAGQSEGRTCIEGHATSRSGALTDHVVAIPLAHRRGRIGIVRRSGEGVVVGTSLRCRCCAGFAQHRLCESCVWGSANNTLLYTVVRYNGHQEKRQMQRCGMSGINVACSY